MTFEEWWENTGRLLSGDPKLIAKQAWNEGYEEGYDKGLEAGGDEPRMLGSA